LNEELLSCLFLSLLSFEMLQQHSQGHQQTVRVRLVVCMHCALCCAAVAPATRDLVGYCCSHLCWVCGRGTTHSCSLILVSPQILNGVSLFFTTPQLASGGRVTDAAIRVMLRVAHPRQRHNSQSVTALRRAGDPPPMFADLCTRVCRCGRLRW
jgi:hypothetical protein